MHRKRKNPLEATSVRIMACFVCGLAALFYCYEFFLRAVPSVMIPELMKALKVNASHIGVLSAFYYYAYTPMQLPVGILMDRYGPRELLTGMVLMCTLGAFLFANTTSLYVAEIGQFLMGFGSAFAFVGVLKLAANWLPQRHFALASGLTTTLGMLGAILCDNALIQFVHNVGWQQAWQISGVVGIVLAILIFFIVRDAPEGIKLAQVEYRDWRHAWLGFKKVMRKKQFWFNGIIGGFLFLPTTAFAVLWGIDFLTQTFSFSSHDAGFGVSMIFLGWAIGGPISGWLSSAIEKRILPIQVGLVIAASLMFFILFTSIDTNKWILFIALFFFGIFSSVQILCFAIGREISPKQSSGTAVAATNFLVMVGGVVIPPIIGALLDMHWGTAASKSAHTYSHLDYQIALLVLPVGLLIALALTFFMKETHCKQSTR